ncbi:MAG: response regulator [Nitrospiraceae bacterium]
MGERDGRVTQDDSVAPPDSTRTSSSGPSSIAPIPLSVLIVEDREEDALLEERLLRKQGYRPTVVCAQTEAEFLAGIADRPDILLLDASLPRFSAHRALEILRERDLDIPSIIVSGSVGEEEAVSLMRAGAGDYLMKDRLTRLGQAVEGVLENKRLRDAHRQAHNALVQLNGELEQRIAERTLELEQANEALARELIERRQIELSLRQHESILEKHVEQRTQQLRRSQERLRRLALELTLAEHSERKRIAADLHDYLAQLLVVTKLNLSQLHRRPELSAVAGVLKETDGHVDDALTYTRTLVSQLSPAVLSRQGLIPALRWLAEDLGKRGLQVTVRGPTEAVPLSDDHAVLLFQSVRELLFNTIKHAKTTQASVTATVAASRLTLIVQDKGVGFDSSALRDGSNRFGLFSIHERMESLGGECRFDSAPGKGTTVTLTIPLNAAQADTPTRENTV